MPTSGRARAGNRLLECHQYPHWGPPQIGRTADSVLPIRLRHLNPPTYLRHLNPPTYMQYRTLATELGRLTRCLPARPASRQKGQPRANRAWAEHATRMAVVQQDYPTRRHPCCATMTNRVQPLPEEQWRASAALQPPYANPRKTVFQASYTYSLGPIASTPACLLTCLTPIASKSIHARSMNPHPWAADHPGASFKTGSPKLRSEKNLPISFALSSLSAGDVERTRIRSNDSFVRTR